MKIDFHKNFEKQYDKLNKKQKTKFQERLKLFSVDPFDKALNNHALKGKYLDYRSINITGDLRAIYKMVNTNECIFAVLGSHSELYY
ncbi:type II toxin-antitoxin system mRNA interferase toxin, RelE/StbE family [Patescibacteria group bacterium]|nr:type II toxin-antitoxin system mRNA interferase toxin, RelE/StbE family [Patescibacteria group bacterium]